MTGRNHNQSKIVFECTSRVEQFYLEKSEKDFIYQPDEKIPVIQVGNFPELGKLTALRFIEWVQKNPKGVISLPTGKTPEHFIKWVAHILKNWETEKIRAILGEVGLDTSRRPDLGELRFVQIDEFYPIDAYQHNSFYYYVNKYYFRNWGLNPEKAMFINVNEIGTPNKLPLGQVFPEQIVDLSRRTRYPATRQERVQKETLEIVDEFCTNYEKRIRSMGGIGFFWGGIGPDGHIGFNVRGSDHYSTSRLIQTNYETQAAAATDLGAIEVAKHRLVITIGLDTIIYNPETTALIIAAGEAKAPIVCASIENDISNKYPATVLQSLKNARFYLTNGAAVKLSARQFDILKDKEMLSEQDVERHVINLSLQTQKPLIEITEKDFKTNKFTEFIAEKSENSAEDLTSEVAKRLVERIERGMEMIEGYRFLHTAPHHDDIMLGYLPYINHLVRTQKNRHNFVYLTSGFTAVTNKHMLYILENLKVQIESGVFEKRFKTNYFDPSFLNGKDRDVNVFLDGIAAHSRTLKNEAESRRMLRNLIQIYEEDNVKYLKDRVDELVNYFRTQYPGKKDIPHVQKLKGMQREWEVEILWGHFGFTVRDVSHLRLGFYQGNIFTEQPEMDRDVIPIYNKLKEFQPNVVTVALDPEGSGPDTHYKVMQAISSALKMYSEEVGNSDIRIWGYRNVWYKFHPVEANVYVPVSLNSFAIMERAFMNSFGSQKTASFPSWEYDGPFVRLAQRIHVNQYHILRQCLSKNYFINNIEPRIRAAMGFVFIKELSLNEFYSYSAELKKLTENV